VELLEAKEQSLVCKKKKKFLFSLKDLSSGKSLKYLHVEEMNELPHLFLNIDN
jgi:hypothetical protein